MASTIRIPASHVRATLDRFTDERAAFLHRHIEGKVHGRIRDLRVVCANGVILLQGHCSTQHTKQLALEAVLDGLDHVQTVVNHIVVR